MTGFRIGYACAPQNLLDAMLRIHQYSMLCAGITSQEAATEALLHGDQVVREMREAYKLRRNFIVKAFNDIGLHCHLPAAAFTLFHPLNPPVWMLDPSPSAYWRRPR